jgi:exopolysaccharide biosynthesis polyprenyl glycosylphosphotransferase
LESSAKQAKKLFEPITRVPYRRPAFLLARHWQLFIITLIASDIAMIGLAFRLAYSLRFEVNIDFFRLDVVPSFPYYQIVSLALVFLWIVVFALTGLYQRPNLLGGTQEYALVFRATNTGMLLVVIVGFLQPEFILARGWLVLAWGFSFFFVNLMRFLLRRFIYYFRQHGYFLVPTLIIGMNQEGNSLAQQLLGWTTSGLSVLGYVADGSKFDSPSNTLVPKLGGLFKLDHLVERHDIRELIVVTSALSRKEITSIFERYGRHKTLNVRLSSGLFEIMTTGLEIKEVANVPLVKVNNLRLKPSERFLKLVLDYVIVLVSVFLIFPLIGAIALMIKLDSPGPIIHRRRVMGLNGRQFCAYKFRTMYVNGDEILAQYPELQRELRREHKLKDDPRVTRVGQYLRKLSLDELPQFINILKREMSVVGPRIISPAEMEMYGQWGMNLLTVHPGLTGLWQISGRSDISYQERVGLDMTYIRNWSIWSDFQILLLTIPAVLKSRGAY